MLPPCALLTAIAVLQVVIGFEPGSLFRHLYLVPTLWAAFTAGAVGGGLIGLLSGLLQAPLALPAVERLGLTSQTVDGLISLATPIAWGWVIGELVDRSRERAARLRAVLEVQRTLSREAPLEESLHEVAERVRVSLKADRVGMVVGAIGGDPLLATAPASTGFDVASVAGFTLRSGQAIAVSDILSDARIALGGSRGPTPLRGLTLAIDGGSGPLGVLAIERSGNLPAATRAAAEEISLHLALAIENVRLTLRQRHFADELEDKVAAATERLRGLDRAKTEFLSVVAHELRTPLTALQGFSEILLARTVPAERATRFLQHIHAEAGRLGRIVTELLDLSRIEAGRGVDLKCEEVALAELIERNVELFATEHRRHRFEWTLSAEVPPLSADRDALDRMLKNLLSNAVKYSPRGGRVAVSAGLAHDHLRMIEPLGGGQWRRDPGPGPAPHLRPVCPCCESGDRLRPRSGAGPLPREGARGGSRRQRGSREHAGEGIAVPASPTSGRITVLANFPDSSA